MSAGFFEKVYALVAGIPSGRVATYGQIAELLGVRNGARAVGWALRALPANSRVPWQRVVGAAGRISLPETMCGREQRRRLRAEGVRLAKGRVELRRHGLWASTVSPGRRAATAASPAPAGGRGAR